MYFSIDNISKKHNEKVILDNASFHLQPNEKVGLIGRNGVGKSTLLKIMAGVETYTGNIICSNQIKIGYLAQKPDFKGCKTPLEYLKAVSDKEINEHQLLKALRMFKIDDENIDLNVLSGGARRRVSIAALTVANYDLILLDEPTNHLDEVMIEYLEKYLLRFSGSMIMVSHDRYFLERVVTRIIEIVDHKINSYPGNYTKYLELKAQELIDNQAHERRLNAIYANEAKWASRGPQGRGTKSRERLERFENLKDSMLKTNDQSLSLDLNNSRLGKKIIEAHYVSFKYSDKLIINDFDYTFAKNDRIGIVGINGSGKTTLFKLLAKRLEPTSGEVIHGETVKIGYYEQEMPSVDPKLKLIDYIEEVNKFLETKDGLLSASKLMEQFLFTKQQQHQLIETLSGGELRRLYLLRVLMQNPNVLFFDEPTNDLDLMTLTILEDYLVSFNGVVVVVSHDRYFLDKICNRIFAFNEDQSLTAYIGGYSDYQDLLNKEKQEVKTTKKVVETKVVKINLTYLEKKELETIDDELLAKEVAIEIINEKLQDCFDNYELLAQYTAEHQKLSEELEVINERWLYLHEKLAQVEAQKKS